MRIFKIHENILVYDWNTVIELSLTGNSGDKDKLRSALTDFCRERLVLFSHQPVFLQLLAEVHRNICDHANGIGRCKLFFRETCVRFEIEHEAREPLPKHRMEVLCM